MEKQSRDLIWRILKTLLILNTQQRLLFFKEKKDWPKLRDSGFLFFRKASSESKELLDYIDEQHLLKETEGNKIK